MARLDLVELKLKLEASKRRLAQLRRQNMLADIQSEREISIVQADLNRLLPYRNSGAIPEQTYVDKEREIERLQTQQLLDANQRVQASNDELLQLNKDQAELNKNSVIRAPISGCIVDQLLMPGSVITPGTTVFWLERNDSRSGLVSYAYFPSKDGKRLRLGQSVRVTPTTTKAQRHGGIQGKILKIRSLPVTREGLVQRFGFQSLVEAIQNTDKNKATDEPQIEVITSLKRSRHTFSGFDWGGGTGPRIELSPGTITEVSVLVEDRQPISYVIPLLRDLSGIY
jgi:NHLM bacteriocin system secretion protein